MTTLRQYEYFTTVAETGHFGRAAEICNVSQPTLSMQLKELEDRLGGGLIERRKKNVLLTPLGEKILPMAKQLLDQASAIKYLASQTFTPLSGPLTLGVIPTIGAYMLPHLIPPLHEKFPELKLYLKEDQTLNLLDQLDKGTLDVALVALMDFDDVKYSSYSLFDEDFVVALPPNDPLLRKHAIMADDLRHGALMLLEQGHCLRNQALDVCQFAAEEASGANFQATSLETLKHMVANGLGRTVLPALSAEEGRGYEVRPFFDPAPTRTIGLVWRRTSTRREEFELLGKTIKKNAPNGTYNV